MHLRCFLSFIPILLWLLVMPCSSMAEPPAWRIRLHEAAVVSGDMVHLGDIAEIYGNSPPGMWEELAARPLWPAPSPPGKPLQINRVKLEQALRQTLGTIADACIFPKSMALQRGGAVLRTDDLRALVVKELTPQLRAMGGQVDLDDFRLPAYIFLTHQGQRIVLDPVDLAPGRITLRFTLREVDESVLRRITGSAMLAQWLDVACAAKPLNRGDAITPQEIRWERMNMAAQRGGELWDGRGGPWQMLRSLSMGQPIYRADLAPLAMLRRGDIVNLVYNKGNVRLSMKAEVLNDGGPGDTIPVRNLQSKKQVYATVRDSETVEIK